MQPMTLGGRGGPRPSPQRVITILAVLAIVVPLVLTTAWASDGPGSSSDGPSRDQAPTFTLSLSPETVQASPSHNEWDNATFVGTVEVDQAPSVSSTILLTATTSQGWRVYIEPVVVEVRGSGSGTFDVTVQVPSKTPATAISTVLVNATLTAAGHSPIEASATGTVTVAPYYRIGIQSRDPLIQLGPGERGEIVVEVLNWGNALTRMMFYIDNVPEGVVIELSQSQAEVLPGDSVNVTLIVTVGIEVRSGTHVPAFRVVTIAMDDQVQDLGSFTITVHVPPAVPPNLVTATIVAVVLVLCTLGFALLWRSRRKALLHGQGWERP